MALLNEKQLKFVEAYADGASGAEAVRKAGYNVKSDGAARVQANRMLQNANVQQAIREAREKRRSGYTVTAAWVLEQIAKIAQDEEIQPRDRLKALEMLAKHHGLLEKKEDNDVGIRVVIEKEAEGWSQ